MKQLLIVGNWKSNKTEDELFEWINSFSQNDSSQFLDKKVVICPPFTLLSKLKTLITENKLSLEIAGQDISEFEGGPFTGEISAKQVKEFGNYTIVGHSERRKNFNETEEILKKKTEIAIKYALTPIFCVESENNQIPQGVEIVAYEPVLAIGTGKPDTPENANEVARLIKGKSQVKVVLYGGSVTSKNIKSFTEMQYLDGVLVGGNSLDPTEFSTIVKLA